MRNLSRALIESAFAVLRNDRVIPTSVYDPYIAAGRDYEGQSVMGLSSYGELEACIVAAYPERFAGPFVDKHPQFPTQYILSLIEACVARCSFRNNFGPPADVVDSSIDELVEVLRKPQYEVVCCRHVCHLTTGGNEVRVGDVTIVPEPEGFGGLTDRIQREIPGAARAWNREDPRPYDPPHSLLIAREVTDEPDHYRAAQRLSHRLDRFILIARLLTGGTVQPTYEITGTSTLISRMTPYMYSYSKETYAQLVRRTVRLTGAEATAFEALGDVIDSAETPLEGMVTTSFGLAFRKFSGAYSSIWYDNLADLVTSLEAILIGDNKETEGLTLRLRSRAATLLAMSDDPAKAIFVDLSKLYNLRSRVVHGGQIKLSDLRRDIGRISTVPSGAAEDRLGVALGYAVDRMRDITRRAILARLCLAAKPFSLWPFVGQTSVDSILVEDAERTAWRSHWHSALDSLGAGYAGEKAQPAADFLSEPEG